MNTSELEMLIRNILSEQLTPEKRKLKETAFFRPLMRRFAPRIRLSYATSNAR